MPGESSQQAERPTVSAVIITRNRRDALGIVLDRLASLPVDEVVVVDNGSDDDTREVVRGRNGNVLLLEPGENTGIAGRNLGAARSTGEFVLQLDDDAYPLPGALEAMLEAFRREPRLGVAAGFVRDVDREGNVVKQAELGTFDWWLRAGQAGEPAEGLPAFFFPEGASLFRRDAYFDAGGFFEPYFYLSSEVDFAARLLEKGWDVRYVPTAAFDHMKAPGGRSHYNALYYRIRNHLWFLWLRFPAPVAALRTVGYLTFDLIEATYLRAPKAWLHAVRDAWRQRHLVRGFRRPLPRHVRRRTELNRGRMHVRWLAGQLRRRLSLARRPRHRRDHRD